MYTLYYSPGACSMAVHVLLNEINAQFKLEKASPNAGETRTPEYLKMNPRGQVPVLLVDGKPLREGAAIITYLADTHKSPLLPAEGWARAQALQGLMFANSTMHPAYSRLFGLMKMPEDTPGKALFNEQAFKQVTSLWQDVEGQLAEQPYLAGTECTVADILLTVIGNWSANFGDKIVIGPKARAMFAKVIARPAYQKALATEGVEYKMAAAA